MHDLELVRAAAEDMASARILLQERIDALEAIIQTARAHGIPEAKLKEAIDPSLLNDARQILEDQSVLAA